MKTAIMLGVLALSLTGANAQTVFVNNVPVDLTPITEWIKGGRKGDRPMPHWREVFPIEFGATVIGGNRATVQIMPGAGDPHPAGNKEIILLNIPAKVTAFMKRYTESDAKLAALRREVALREEQLRYLAWEDQKDPIGSEGESARYNIRKSQRADVLVLRDNANRALVAELAAREQAIRERREELTMLAMFTGRKVGDVEVWDCGRVK